MAEPRRRRAVPPDESQEPAVEKAPGIWRMGTYDAARQVLQARGSTTQAGFTSEFVPKGLLKHHPILFSDGSLHDEQRRKVGRFFAPRVVTERYQPLMVDAAERLLAGAEAARECLIEDLALLYSVDVTRQVVGLTESPVEALAARLARFFNQPSFDITKPDLGRTRRQWAAAAINGLRPLLSFYLSDVRPAIRKRRRDPADDVISHLIAEGYTDTDILVECVTYGTAGMVTTREFITMAAWHLLADDGLRERFRAAGVRERYAILNEIIRLEPVVGHLYRRASAAFEITDAGRRWRVEEGDLVDVCVRDTNADERAVGEDALDVRPGRPLPSGVNEAVLTFGDGAHRCPGQPLAIAETEVLLTRLLDREPRIVAEPALGWDDLVAGYTLRGFELSFGRPAREASGEG